MFDGKKILFISPRFFNYEMEIRRKLVELGAEVVFFDERPSNSAIKKALIRVNRKLLNWEVNSYYRNVFEQIKDKDFDYIFLIKGEAIPGFFLELCKARFSKARFIYYSYDSIRNNANAYDNFKYFHSKFSFDDTDVENVLDLRFLPLFYLDRYAALEKGAPEYDISFIGTVHSDRYLFVRKLIDRLEKNASRERRYYLFFFCQSRWYFYLRKLVDKNFQKANKSDISFTPLSRELVFEVFSKSGCIIDIQHPRQTGLTIRTIEALGARKKIITTNRKILEYDFYHPDNVLLVDRVNPEVSLDFLEKPYVDIPDQIYRKYSIGKWLETVFTNSEI